MRIIDLKLYLLMILICGLLVVFVWINERKNTYEKLMHKIKYFLYIIPILCLLIVLYLKVMTKIKGIQMYFQDILITSFLVSIEILISAQISRNITSFLRNKALSNKYGGKELTKKEIDYINDSKELTSNLWGCILMFIMCGLIYSIISEFIFNEYKLKATLITALFSTICYWFISTKLFRNNK
ncbi:MAG: hypothetical protein HUJ77_11755 [Clostridium sp.]|uniref:hypothetical protein n=1 Tax=Clostridium sp. TaxID=1506 RepID=UPI0025BEB5B0|nr:hypothetical protein [Clostridium sp.]MCF0149058.1 hypothetical protein [Clostridium sp.]